LATCNVQHAICSFMLKVKRKEKPLRQKARNQIRVAQETRRQKASGRKNHKQFFPSHPRRSTPKRGRESESERERERTSFLRLPWSKRSKKLLRRRRRLPQSPARHGCEGERTSGSEREGRLRCDLAASARHLNVFFVAALSIRVRNSCELAATFCRCSPPLLLSQAKAKRLAKLNLAQTAGHSATVHQLATFARVPAKCTPQSFLPARPNPRGILSQSAMHFRHSASAAAPPARGIAIKNRAE